MRNHFWLATALLLFITFSCEKPGTSGDPSGNDNYEYSDDFVLKEGVIYFDQTNAKYLVVKDEDWLVLKNDAPATLVPVVGNIVLASQSDNTPYGFMGRVSSVTETAEGKEIRAESVALDEVFEELHLEKNIDIAEQLDELVDEDGNPVEVETIDNSFWDQFNSENEDEVKTKTEYIHEEHFTKAISLSAQFLKGSLILSSNLYTKINIEKGIIHDYSIVLRSATSISGRLSFRGKANKEFGKTVRLPGAIWVGPIALRPAIVYGLGLTVSGEVSMDGPLTIGLSSTTTRWENNNPGRTFIDKSHPVSCKATYLNCDGSFTINGQIGIQFGVFGQRLLALGIDWQPDISIGLSGEMHMEDKKMMVRDPEARISGSFGTFGAYLDGKFIKKLMKDKVRVSVQTPSLSYVIPLFDRGDKHKCFKKTGEWGLSGEFGKQELFLNIEKKGYALFKVGQEEPVSIQAAPSISASVKSADTEFSFKVPDNPLDYCVRTLNILKDDSGKEYQFFGHLVGDFIKSISVQYGTDYHCTLPFEYDEFGRLVSAGSYRYSYAESSLIITGGRYGFPVEDTLMPQEWHISLDSNGTITGGSYSSGKSTELSITSGCSSYRFPESDYEHYVDFSWENNTLTQIHEHGEIPMSEGKVDIFDHYYDYSYGSYRNSLGTTDLSNYIMDMQIPPFVLIPGIVSEFLPTGYTFTQKYSSGYTSKETIGFSYTLDDVGRIHSFKTRQYSGTITYKDINADDEETRL